jgi:NADPH2:quinone reductase
MYAWQCSNPVGFDSLTWEQVDPPSIKPNEVLIEVKAASLNFPDALMVRNEYQTKPKLPFTPGSELAGLVVEVGAEVADITIGQRVACFSGTGAFATHAVVAADECIPLPDTLAYSEGAAFITTYATAYHALIDRANLQCGESVLVLGASGGVGTAALQIAKAVGAKVTAAASSEEKCSLAIALGADHVINYAAGEFPADFRSAIKRSTDGQGPNVIFDPVGGKFSEPAFRSIAWKGRHLVVGFAAGDIPSLPLNLLLLKGATVSGVFWADHAKREPMQNEMALNQIVRWITEGLLTPVIHKKLPMINLKEAFSLIENRQVQGKLVLEN